MALGHSFASASARPSRIPELLPHACSHAPPTRRFDIMLRKRTPQSHLLYVGCCTCLVDCFVNEVVRRWLWGIHLLQRLRVPPGFPSFPRMPVVMLLQLGASTLCLRKRTPQSHLLWLRCRLYLLACFVDETVHRMSVCQLVKYYRKVKRVFSVATLCSGTSHGCGSIWVCWKLWASPVRAGLRQRVRTLAKVRS